MSRPGVPAAKWADRRLPGPIALAAYICDSYSYTNHVMLVLKSTHAEQVTHETMVLLAIHSLILNKTDSSLEVCQQIKTLFYMHTAT